MNPNPKPAFLLLIQKLLWDFSLLRKLYVSLLILGFCTFLLVYLHLDVFKTEYKLTSMVHSILGLALGLLLVFRTNTAYDKWWEGRKLLGSLVNNSRNLAIKSSVYFSSSQDKDTFRRLLSAFPIALRNHLRDEDKMLDLGVLPELYQHQLKSKQHIPNELIKEMYRLISQKNTQYSLSDFKFLSIDNHLRELTDITGACERIKNTPLPKAYTVHLRQFLNLYLFTLPLPLVHELAYWSVPTILVIFYALAGVKNIGEEIEEPFGKDKNDLPLDAICQRITLNIEEIFEGNEIDKSIDNPIFV
jgi:ion channel-forming bestrophin family protein